MKNLTITFLFLLPIQLLSQVYGGQRDYKYDSLNRLVKAVFENGMVYEYSYDNLGNRLQMKISYEIDSSDFTFLITNVNTCSLGSIEINAHKPFYYQYRLRETITSQTYTKNVTSNPFVFDSLPSGKYLLDVFINGIDSSLFHYKHSDTLRINGTLINYSYNDTITVCNGDTVTFHDGTVLSGISTNTQHINYFNSVLGCDSNITTQVYVNPTQSTAIFDTACQGTPYLFGGTSLQVSGNYTNTLSNSFGCDSIIRLSLYVKPIDTNITQRSDTLFATITANSYQWIKCDSASLPLTGEINDFYVFNSNGLYAVILTKNGCIDTSVCFLVNNVSIKENDAEHNFNLSGYPNPTNGQITIQINSSQTQFEQYTIYDNLGKIVTTGNLTNNVSIVNLERYSNGLYFISVSNQSIILFEKIFLKN